MILAMVTSEIVSDVMNTESRSLAELSEAVEQGLPKSALKATAKHLYAEPSEQTKFVYRVVPEATFKRRQGRLSPAESERTERLARMVATAEYCLNSKEAARLFLTSPHWKFNNRIPIEVAMTELGGRQVEQLLFSLSWGLPA